MSNERNAKTNPSTAERVGGSVKKPEQPRGDEPDFKTLFHAWLESHRASLVDSVGRLLKQPIGSFFTCLVMAVALSLPMGLALLLDNVERLGGSWQRAAQISLFMQLDVDAATGGGCATRWPECRTWPKPSGSVASRRWKSSSSYPASARRSRSCRRTRCPASSW